MYDIKTAAYKDLKMAFSSSNDYEYRTSKFVDIYCHKMSNKDQLIKASAIGAAFSFPGWMMHALLGVALFLVIAACVMFVRKTYELRGKLRAIDETGELVVTLAKSNSKADAKHFEDIANQVQSTLYGH